jgi:hypothetical protein
MSVEFMLYEFISKVQIVYDLIHMSFCVILKAGLW